MNERGDVLVVAAVAFGIFVACMAVGIAIDQAMTEWMMEE